MQSGRLGTGESHQFKHDETGRHYRGELPEGKVIRPTTRMVRSSRINAMA